MKKKFGLILFLVICLMFCNISFAVSDFKDVKGTKYEEAVKNLVDIGLVNGYAEDNTYRPSNAVTRAEMAKLMVIALGEEGKLSTAKQQKNVFTDIKSEHWAYGYVNIAKDLKIVNGYTDGSFAPEDTVTYAEAVTMIVRALGYDVEVEKSTETWPNNYISYAKKLSLLTELGTFKNDNGAQRGDVANLLWKMLRTGVCTVKSQSVNGGLVYGQGQKMLNKYKKYTYLKDATITSVSFSDDYEEAKVTITGDEKLTITMSAEDVLAYYGRKLDLLYNENSKKFSYINIVDSYKKEKYDLLEVKDDVIYVEDNDDEYDYDLPDDDNILLYGVEDIDDALEATLIFDGKKLKYVIASGTIKSDIGLVISSDELVNKKDGIKMKKLGNSTTYSYVLADEDDMPEEGSVILYYLNAKEEIEILREINVDDAKEITSATSTKLKVGGKTYTYDEDEFVVISADKSSVKTLDFKKIDDETDLVYVFDRNNKTYLIVFLDSVISDEEKDDLWDDLKDYIDSAEDVRESKYTQETYGKLFDALETAKGISKSSSATKMSSALSNLKSAYNGLKAVAKNSTEADIAEAREELRELVNSDIEVEKKTVKSIESNKSTYTTSSYNTFNTELVRAKDILSRTNTTEKEVINAYNNLSNAMKKLEVISNTTEHKNAVSKLEAAITRAGKEVKAQSNYTSASWEKYSKALSNANTVKKNASSKSVDDIQKATYELETAMSELKSALKTANELEGLLAECLRKGYDSNEPLTYMPKAFTDFKTVYENAIAASGGSNSSTVDTAYKNLDKAIKNLENNEIADIYTKTGNEVATIINIASSVKEAYVPSSATQNGDRLGQIVLIFEGMKTDLKSLLDKAKEMEEGGQYSDEVEYALSSKRRNNRIILSKFTNI